MQNGWIVELSACLNKESTVNKAWPIIKICDKMGTYIFITFVPRVLISRYPPPWNHDRHRGGILKGLLLKPPALHGSGARSTTGIWKVKIQSQKSLACEWWLLWILFKIHKKTNFCFFQSEFPFVFWILEKPHFLWVKVLHFKTIYICLYNIEAKYH